MRGLLLVVAAALAGCAAPNPYASAPVAQHLERDDDVGYCARLFADLDHRIDTLGVRDAETTRIAGYPYLRVDRLTEALAERADDGRRRDAWLARMAALDDMARTAELANAGLPDDDLARCRVLLAAADAGRDAELRARARVPDDYSREARALGLYPLTRYALAAGVARWQAGTRAVFATPLEQLPVQGQLVRYGPVAAAAVDVRLPVATDPLGVPQLSRFDRTALLQRHAPVLEIDVTGPHDRPGTVLFDDRERAAVDPGAPIAYTRVAHTLIGGRAHVQLVYTFWFSRRPARHWFDPLAGRLDGLVWRVTLGQDGVPLVYDSIHPCGCYHLFFPTERVVRRERPGTLDETAFVAQVLPAPGADHAVVLRVAAGSHYVQRVRAEPRRSETLRYRFDDERRLTVLALPGGGTRSMYEPDGLVAGTERGERFFLWPSGVVSPGQARQWGRHATAFVGIRHFDDPGLIGAYFAPRGPAERAAP